MKINGGGMSFSNILRGLSVFYSIKYDENIYLNVQYRKKLYGTEQPWDQLNIN